MLQCDNPFWAFSLAVYAQPGVAAECLTLQKTLNVDVNVLLYCAWIGADRKIVLSAESLDAVDANARGWHDTVVRPLRAVRQAMKPMPDMADEAVKTLRQDIAAAELRAEQIEQALLFERAAQISEGATAASAEQAVTANVMAFIQRCAAGAENAPLAPRLIAAASAYAPVSRAPSQPR